MKLSKKEKYENYIESLIVKEENKVRDFEQQMLDLMLV